MLKKEVPWFWKYVLLQLEIQNPEIVTYPDVEKLQIWGWKYADLFSYIIVKVNL